MASSAIARRATSIPLRHLPGGLRVALLRPSSCLVRVPQLSMSHTNTARNYGSVWRYGVAYGRIFGPEIIVASSIALCTGVFLYERHLEIESMKPREYSRSVDQRDFRTSSDIFKENFVLSRRNVEEGRWWTLVTHTFVHHGVLHWLFNMMGIWYIGRPLALFYGPTSYVALWLAAGAGGGYTQLYWQSIMDKAVERKLISQPFGIHGGYEIEAVGASGSIMGMLAVLTCAFPRFYLGQAIIAVGISAVSLAYDAFPQIGHISHLSGFGMGTGWWLLFLRRRFR